MTDALAGTGDLSLISAGMAWRYQKHCLVGGRGLGKVVREHKARLYIIRRCVVMLLCWHD
ncbi:hypothetical protein C2845_PM08G14680 [Panicum miliaceum]|uniref:Uncharacterized protein n=1 Tax=Panicum miliaceum TaxID=4540 RepID=A0A3L6QY21_PANMI|nr:hypothetical protein C2845_PM08G14680 [Panicum miliaceum]